MAIIDAYVNADLASDKKANPAYQDGNQTRTSVALVSVAADDDDTSKYRIARVQGRMVPARITAYNTAITGGTDYDLGIYRTAENGGTVKVADVLADGVSFASARAEGSSVSLLSNVAVADAQKKVFELAGDASPNEDWEYDIVLTANVVGTVAGTIAIKIDWVQG